MARNDADGRFERAFALHRNGRLAEARAQYDALLADVPRHAPALHFSAVILHGSQRSLEALERIERSLSIDDRVSDVWNNAGLIYMALGRGSDAARAFDRALRLEPTLAEAWLNRSSLDLAVNDGVAAEVSARRALSLVESPHAWFNLALALDAQRRPVDALAALDRLEAGSAVDPADVTLPRLRAQLLIAIGQADEACRVLDRTLLRVDDPMLRLERARLADAVDDERGAIDGYRAALRGAAAASPVHQAALSELLFLKKRRASWDGLAELQTEFRDGVVTHGSLPGGSALTPFSFLSDPSTREEQKIAARAWSRRYFEGSPQERPLSRGRLRIGYLSSDLHEHATGVLAVGLFEQHDRERFEIFAYSTGPDDATPLRRRLIASFDHFVDARGWTDARIAEIIRDDGIDILVDLKGHTERAATEVMARRPAPIAVSYLGYPGTMGALFIDYLIGDAIVTPLSESGDYDETLVLLPHTYQVTDDRRAIAASPTRAELGLPDGVVVFCCFNNHYKIGSDVFDAWCDVLMQVPRSVLWLLTRSDDDLLRNRVRGEAAARGIEPDRIVFGDTRPHADYLALYRRADLFLDSWPYNAHTTASDALWVGCPVLTVRGPTFAGRVAASLLAAVGMPEGIAADRSAYVAIATRWGNDSEQLDGLRKRLERDARTSPLFDTRATTRAIEAAYLEMATQKREGRRAAIVVED
ncbi:MAG: tetratricopeptide repeat protein [Burkholderiaceae bacterium]